MNARLLKHWDTVRSSFWFVPALMAAAAAALALASVELDEAVADRWLARQGWAYTGGAEGASAVLQTIAGSMISVAGVVFSITLVALSLASSQFGPRLLRNFMRDTANQIVLGTFIATFLYCLLVLRTIRHAEHEVFVPHLSVSLGLLFALASLWVLIYFIHHVAVSIQAEQIIARVGEEMAEQTDRLFPEKLGRGRDRHAPGSPDTGLPDGFDEHAAVLCATGEGYLQVVDGDALLACAVQEDALLRIERRPGRFVVVGSPLLRVWPAECLSDRLADRLRSAFVLGDQRTSGQDFEFTVQQLVEIAVRALSPGVNDPFTAVACVDRLGSGLCRLAGREMPSPCRYDEDGRLRVVVPPITFAAVVDTAFDQIRQHSRSSVAVSIRLLEAIAAVAAAATRREDTEALARQAAMVLRGAREGVLEDDDRRAVERSHAAVEQALRRG